MIARLQSMMSLMALVIRILLWPLRRLSRIAFPPNDLDGLSPAVTAKAAQSFVSALRKQYPSCDWDLWSTTGFSALKNEATTSHSLLLVYLHSPLHRQANLVVENILTTQTFQEFLSQPNVLALGCSIHSGQGLHLAQLLSAASFPLIALLQPSSSTLSLLLQVQGPVLFDLASQPQDQLVHYMTTALTRHQVQLAEQEARRLARQEEAQLRREQDEEYHATLRADQERQRLQREEEEERIRLEQEAVQRENEIHLQRQESLQRAREAVRSPPTEGGTRIRFVLPSGKKMVRTFESDETIGALKAYLTVQFHDSDDGIERIGLSTNYPKKTYSDDDMTLEEAGLSPQAVLMVQDLDA